MADSDRLIAALVDPAYLSRLGSCSVSRAAARTAEADPGPEDDPGAADELREANEQDALARAVDSLAGPLANGHGQLPYVKEGAATALGKLRHPRAVEVLIEAFSDPSLSVCQQALWALGAIRDPRSADALFSYLHNGLHKGNGEIIDDVYDVLADLGDTRVVPMLIECVSTRWQNDSTIARLAKFGVSVLPELDRLGESGAGRVKTAAREAAMGVRSHVAAKAFRNSAVQWRETGNAEVPYDSTVGLERWQVRINDGPLAWLPPGCVRWLPKHFCLFVDGQAVERFIDWPRAWRKPGGPS